MSKKYSEIKKELKFVFKDKNYFDLLILPIIFVTSNFILGFDIAVLVVILVSIIILIYRFYKKEKIKYSIIGLLGTLLLILITNLSGQQKTYFAPSLISSAATSVLCIVSLFFKKPLVAYTSSVARRWPIKWY